ncbi:MAG: septum formation initiator family protein [Tissierellia bacterium]|nr:septum formation initiator family protein [Tissierellia bacterium]
MDRESKRKRLRQIQARKKQVRTNRVFLLVLIILLISMGLVYGQRRKIKDLNKAYNDQVESQKRLKERVDALQAEIKQANTLEYIEKKAREELGMIKKSEKIYLEKDDKEGKAEDGKEDKQAKPEKDNQENNTFQDKIDQDKTGEEDMPEEDIDQTSEEQEGQDNGGQE